MFPFPAPASAPSNRLAVVNDLDHLALVGAILTPETAGGDVAVTQAVAAEPGPGGLRPGRKQRRPVGTHDHVIFRDDDLRPEHLVERPPDSRIGADPALQDELAGLQVVGSGAWCATSPET